jgi:hypothetical protein
MLLSARSSPRTACGIRMINAADVRVVGSLIVKCNLFFVARSPLAVYIAPRGKARRGEVGLGVAWHGRARHGRAGQGRAGLGKARQGFSVSGEGSEVVAWRGRAGHGGARRGRAWRGMAGQGRAWPGKARKGVRYDQDQGPQERHRKIRAA